MFEITTDYPKSHMAPFQSYDGCSRPAVPPSHLLKSLGPPPDTAIMSHTYLLKLSGPHVVEGKQAMCPWVTQ